MSLEMLDNMDKSRMEKRGEGTKYALIMAGIEVFGEHGPKNATVRMIAEKASANVASIPYYFGGKDGLYIAVVEYIAQQVLQHLQQSSAYVNEKLSQDNLSAREALTIYLKMKDNILTSLIEGDEPKSWAQILMREHTSPTPAFDVVYKKYFEPTQKITYKCISICTGLPADSDEVKIISLSHIGLVLGFHLKRETLMRSLNVKKLKREHIELIRKTIKINLESSLQAYGVLNID
ncbi:CerR family C-terminal domain-containing protein [Agarilytica rhodophyticola]|uniref:CerR family C-terminal domain-containing protein n=1 Tax=Agarilytica rhodophyticola TaxID=1737490 RepID=UPI000CD904CA|nr:CerR family C-terminal domain-containing protein [Agarilytica rhodophyticola]